MEEPKMKHYIVFSEEEKEILLKKHNCKKLKDLKSKLMLEAREIHD